MGRTLIARPASLAVVALILHVIDNRMSTAMPLCHWPCNGYPNHALGQANDWMNAICLFALGRMPRREAGGA